MLVPASGYLALSFAFAAVFVARYDRTSFFIPVAPIFKPCASASATTAVGLKDPSVRRGQLRFIPTQKLVV